VIVLVFVKTSHGAQWAATQAYEIAARGVQFHIAVPDASGPVIRQWERAGAKIHVVDASLGRHARRNFSQIRKLVQSVSPNIIHCHFPTNAIAVRMALGYAHSTPRLFQVPGPLHLETAASRWLDLVTAGPRDVWIGSSEYISRRYLTAGVRPDRVHTSYYGIDVDAARPIRTNQFRRSLGIPDDAEVVGNANIMYPPKYHLGHRHGIKRHELVIESLSRVIAKRPQTWGVLIGGAWGGADWYARKLQHMAGRLGRGRILLTGSRPHDSVLAALADYDCVVHVPSSENCGGVVEPLLCGVPVVAAAVGGIPEVIVPDQTGVLVDRLSPDSVAQAIEDVLDRPAHHRQLAANGASLARELFDIRRTAGQVFELYRSSLRDAGVAFASA
jgi:glycosyltransferase involved in cell wall biosynthesis